MASAILYGGYCQAGYFDSEILRDLKGIRVNLGFTEETATLLKINLEHFKNEIESKLDKSGINIYKNDTTEFYKAGRPEIQINIRPFYIRSEDSIDFDVETSFVITMRSFTNPKATNRVPVTYWRDFKCNGTLKDILEIVDKHIELFSEAICAPKKGEICRYSK